MVEKNFWSWHKEKQKIHNDQERVRFHVREVWWCALGANIGSEEDGKNTGFERPVIVFRKFNTEIFWALPITTKEKTGPYYFNFFYSGRRFSAILSQIRLLDAKRLKRKIRTLSKEEWGALCSAFSALIP